MRNLGVTRKEAGDGKCRRVDVPHTHGKGLQTAAEKKGVKGRQRRSKQFADLGPTMSAWKGKKKRGGGGKGGGV
jgi:hypothetical protein